MRQLKIVAIIAAALFGLAILGAAAVVLLVNPNDYRAQLERLAQARTGRELKIAGPLNLKLFPWLALSLSDVRLGNPPGYGSGPFLTVQRASVGVKLLPLLAKRLEVSQVTVDGLTANLVSRSDRDNNWKDLAQSKGGESQGGAGPTQTYIRGVDILNAALSYRDEAKKSVTSLSNLEIHTGSIGGTDAVHATVAFDYGDGGKKPAAHLSIAARAQLPGESGRLSLGDLDVQGTWFGDAAPGAQPLSFSLRSAEVTLDPQAQTLTPATFDVKVGDLALQLSAAGEKLFTDRVVTGKIAVSPVSARKAMQSLGLTAPVTRDPRVLATFSLNSDFRLTPQQARLANLRLTLDDTHVLGDVAVENLETMALSYELKIDALDADRYLPPKQAAHRSTDAASKETQPPPIRLPIETLRKLNAHGTAQIGSATFGGLVFTGVTLPVAAADGRVRIGPAQAHLLGGVYDGDTVLDARPAQAQLSLNEHVKGMDVGAFMKVSLETTRVSGHGDANAIVTGVGNTDTDILRSLNGKIDVNVKEGAINGIDLWYELRRARAVVKRDAVPARTGPERTVFNTFSGSGTLDKGILKNDDLSIETDYLKVHGGGTLDLGAKTIDYRVVAQLYKLPPEGAGSELKDLKAADIPFTLTGSLQNMALRPDIEAFAKGQLRQEVNEKLQGKQDELKKKLGDKLRDLLGR